MHFVIIVLKFIAGYFAISTLVTAPVVVHVCRINKRGDHVSSGYLGIIAALFLAWPISLPWLTWAFANSYRESWRYNHQTKRNQKAT